MKAFSKDESEYWAYLLEDLAGKKVIKAMEMGWPYHLQLSAGVLSIELIFQAV